MSRESLIAEVGKLAKSIDKPIHITRFKRTRIVQEEIVSAYQSPVPSGIKEKGKTKMVEKGDWVAIHDDGSQSSFTKEEFTKIFEPVKTKS